MRTRTAWFPAALLLASGFMGLRAAVVERFVAPGDTGRILLSIENDKGSEAPLDGPEIELTSSPDFQVRGTSILKVPQIAPGAKHDFVVDYSISVGALDGPLSIDVMPRSETEGLQPDLDFADATIKFLIDARPPAVVIHDSNGLVEANGSSAGHEVNISVDDRAGGVSPAPAVSGLKGIDIYQGHPDRGGSLLASNSSLFDTDHIYTQADAGLGILAQLPEVPIYVRVTDKAGNATVSHFIVRTPAPAISVSGVYGFLFDRLRGTGSTVPSTLATEVSVIIQDVVGITAISLPAGASSGALPPGTKERIVHISGLTPGIHQFSATSVTGKSTLGAIKVDTLNMSVVSHSASFDQQANSFSATASLAIESSLPVAGVDVLNGNTSSIIARLPNGPITLAVTPSTSAFYLAVRDAEVNTASFGFQTVVEHLEIPFVADPLLGTWIPKDLFVAGSGAATATIPLEDGKGTPGLSGFMRPAVVYIVLSTHGLSGINYTLGKAESLLFPGPVPLLTGEPRVGTYEMTVNGNSVISGTFLAGGNLENFATNPIPITTPAADFLLTLNANPASGVPPSYCALSTKPGVCDKPLVPTISVRPTVRALRYALSPPNPGPNHIAVYPGAGQNFSLGGGIAISGFSAYATGIIPRAGLRTAAVDADFVNFTGTQVYEITGSQPAFYDPVFTLKLPYDPAQHTTARKTYLARLDACIMKLFEGTVQGNTISAPVEGFGQYAVVESRFLSPNAVRHEGGKCHFVSPVAGVSVGDAAPSQALGQALDIFGSLGLAPLGSTCRLGPTGAKFNPAGVIKLCYDPAVLAAHNVAENAVKLYQFNEAGHRELLENLSVDFRRGIVSASVRSLSSIFGVFTPTASVPARDLLPPITSLALDRGAVSSAYFVMTTTSTLSLSATDPAFPGAPVSGAASTRILIDETFVDSVTTPGQPYAGAFNVNVGSHTVAFYSIDHAGNVETPRVVNVLANPPPTRGVGGLGIGRDAANRLWTVALDGASVVIARTNDAGIAVASAPLPNALSEVQWGVLFDDAGSAYAVGTAAGPSTMAADLAIYKASMSGDAVVASQILDGGFASNDHVFDVAAPGWIAGAVQVSGPSDLEIPGDRITNAALWRFNTANGVVTLSTTFAQGAAMGVAVDADGSVWVAGYVENQFPRSSRAFDLGLWHFAPDGKTLLAGPFLREAYVADLSPTFATKILITGSAVTVVAPRGRLDERTDLGSVRFDKTSGAVLAESAWRAADGSGAYPAALLSDGSGALAAGGLDAGDTRGALWRYGADGGFASASLVAAGGARGAVARGTELWLAVDGATTPYKVTGETPSPGALSDIQPPRVELAATAPSFVDGNTVFVTSMSLLSFIMIDDKLAAGDGLGAGGGTVRYFMGSTGTYAAFSTPFVLTAEGSYSATFYGVDAADNPGAILTRSIGVDLTAPVAMLVSSGSVYAIEAEDPLIRGAASGVAERSYLIDVDPSACDAVAPDTSAPPGTCANDLYAGPFVLAPGTHTVHFTAVDRVGNESEIKSQAITVTPDIRETGQARFVFFFGSQGNAPGQFVGTVNDVAVDHLGAVYASDFFGSKINKYDADGNFLLSWGQPGSGPGEFGRGSHGITISLDPYNNHVLATDPLYPRVQIFTSTGGFLRQIGPTLAGSSHSLSGPTGAACDKMGNVYIADFRDNRIFKTDHDGNFLKTWVIPSLPGTPAASVWHVRVGADGNVYITGGSWVLKFSPEGALLQRFGQQGSLSIPGNFSSTRGLDFDAANNLYATDNQCQSTHCVVVFDPTGSVISSFGTSNAGPERISASLGLAVNKNTGRIYVADSSNNRIGVWDVAVPTSDIRVPITALAPLGPTTSLSDDSLIVSPTTPISFAATDVASPGLAPSGVLRTEYRLDGGPLTVFTAPFTVADVFTSLGYRLLEFRSIDKAGNVEAFQSRQVRVDSLPPRSALFIDGVQMTNLAGAPTPLPGGVVTTASRLTFVALDSGRRGTAGINTVSATLGGTAVALSTSSLRPWDAGNDRFNGSFDLAVPLREGAHSLSWQSIDRVGIAEQTRTLSFVVSPAPADPAEIRTFRSTATLAPGIQSSDIAVDVFGNVYVASLNASDLKKYSPEGAFISSFFLTGKDGLGVGVSPAFVAFELGDIRKLLVGRGASVSIYGAEDPVRFVSELTGFTKAADAAFDGQGNIYVADAGARRISVFGYGELTPRVLIGQGLFVDGPYRIAIDRNGVIYATDRGPARVLKFLANGEFLGELRGPLNQADGLGVDLYGNIYVADKLDNLVRVFSSTGGLLTQFGGTGGARGQLLSPSGLAVHPNSGRVYVADNGNSRIQVFTPDPPPAAVEDLSAATTPDTEVLLRWTAPGDDAMVGRAASYDLRRSMGPILTASAFLEATPVPGLPAPQPGGFSESFLATGLPGGTTLYFALRTTDSGGGVSKVSNNALIRLPFLARSTAAVGGKPEIVFSVDGVQPAVTLLSSATTVGAVVLASASSSGLAAVSAIYDLAPEGVLFEPAAVLTMRYSTRTLAELGLSEADVALYRFDSRLGWVKVAGQIVDTDRKLVTVSLSRIASIFAVLAVVRDDVPPITTIQTFGGAAFLAASEGLYVSSPTRFGLSSFDPLKLGTASGVASTEFRMNAATSGALFQAFAAPFLLPEGSHRIEFRSRDKAGNLEVLKSSAVTVDASAPVIVLHSPLGGETFVAKQSSIAVRVAALDNFDASPRLEVFLVQLEDRGSPRGGRPARVAVNPEQVISPLEIDDGLWTLEVKARDFVGNSTTTISRSFEVIHDIRPPRTSASIGEPRFIVAGSTYVTRHTPLSLPAVDDLLVIGDGVGLGVRQAFFAVDSDASSVLTGSMTIAAEGSRALRFFSVDVVGNTESTQTLTLQVDNTAPVSTITIGAPLFAGTNGTLFVSSSTPFALSAVDLSVEGAASGLKDAVLSLDASAFQVFAGTFTLSPQDGLRGIRFFSRDNLLNTELVRSAAVALDNTAPATALAVLGGRQFPGPNATSFYASSDTRLALPAVDPTVNGVASGLALTQWQDNGGAFLPFASSFGLLEGTHALGYQSQDRVRNLEVLRSTTVLIDATPPVTAAQLGAPLFTAVGGINYIAPATPVTFTAVDPTISGVASGVNRIEVAIDGGAFVAYSTALTFAEGRHTILYRAVDNVANLETVQTLQVQSDATPSAASLAIGRPSFDPGSGRPVFVAAATLLSLSAQDPVVMNVASGVRLVSFRGGGEPFGTYAAPFALALPDGLKTLDYFATDNVGNQEVNRSTTVALDASAPMTTMAVLGGTQFPGPNAASFYASSDTRLALPAVDPVVGGVASGLALTQWQDNSGAFQNFAAPFGLAEGIHLLAYQSQDRVLNMEVPRSTTVLVDATPPVSTVAIGAPTFTASDGTIYITPSAPLTLSAVDPALPTGQPGSAVRRIEVAIDGGPFAVYSTALTFAEGRHTILYRAIDNVANVETTRTLQVRSDATSPVSSLVVGQPQFQLPSVLLVSTRTPFEVAAVDPIVSNVASGVKDTSFRVSGSPYSAFTAPFTMTGGDANKVIEFFSRDNVLNTEVVKSSTVLLDSTPPEVALLSPASCGAGICRVLKGKFPVLGTARDTHFADYRLEFAPGKDASTGFALISSGTRAVSSATLGTWDATALSGWFTVRLSATDLVANATSIALNVFVGDPGQLLLLGNHEIFDMPEGVAVGADGKIYVADRNNDRIAVFSSTGALLISLGGHKDDDDHKKSTTTLRLNKPSGVAVDASGNVYVADTNRDRVLKLSAAGQVLLTLGRVEHEIDDEQEHTRLPGQFQHPAGVAVDSALNIFVADTGNHRVQVFNSTGVFRFQFDLPPVPAGLDDDDEMGDDDDGERAELGKPAGIAVDAGGHIYVADPKGGRALKFGATGQLLLTIPIVSDKPGHPGKPFGVAVSAEGDCLLVSDRKTSRILKFDFLGNSNLVFASKGKIDDAPAPSTTIVLKKPMGLALDAQGNLFVADRNNDRIQKFGLPTGAAPLVVPTPKHEDNHIARGVVDTEDGGKVERRDRAAVDIPAGAVAFDIKVTVSTPAFSVVDDSNRRRAAEDAKLKTASPPVEYGPHGTQFEKSVTLTLPYSPELIALQKIDAKDLQVRYWNRDKSKWEDLESVVDPKTRTVKAKTTHFSLYQVFSGTVSASAFAPLAADAAFTFRDAYAFPNPVRGSGPVTIRIQTGLADSVEVRVYDVSGRKIHSSSNFSLNPNLDDGNGKGAQYTYDHVWDVSGVGSGVYQYVITAKKSGQSDIHKTGRVGVVK